jgi:hypothetical protein
MRPRHDRLVLGVAAGLVLVITLAPLVVDLVRMIRTPPPQHPGLVFFGFVGEALTRLAWSLGGAAMLLVVRAVAGAISTRTNREHRRIRFPRSWREGPHEEGARGNTSREMPSASARDTATAR